MRSGFPPLVSLSALVAAVAVAATAVTRPTPAPTGRYSMVRGDGLPPRAPDQYFHAQRAYPLGFIPRDRWRAAQAEAAAMQTLAPPGAAIWTPRGPTNVGGRITDVAVHPLDGDVVYIGAADGGVLRTTDAGETWTPLFDDQPSLAIGALAIDPSDPDVIYAGTGEVNPGGGSVAYGGAGLFRSADAGETWQCVGLEESGSIGRIRVDPTDPDRIFVAVTGYLWETGPDRGVYRTTDGGDTWQRVHFIDDETGCVDLVMRPDDPDVLYAAMWERLRQPEFYDYGGDGCGVWRTLDGGDTWTLVGGGLPAPDANGGRIGLSLCDAQPDVMHVAYADRTGFFDGIYRSTDGGFSWTQTNDGSLSSAYASFGWWFGNIRTHPVDPDRIFLLGLNFYRSIDGGGSYQNASGGMHVDHHGLAFGSGANPVMYEGNDGGMYRSTNGGTDWTKLPDLPVTQAYRIALDANHPNAVYIGTQDNGTNRTLTASLDEWQHIFGGDGFQALVHPLDSDAIWAQSQYGGLGHSDDGGDSWDGATGGTGGGDRHNWNSPLVQDPTDPDTRYFGTNKLYRSASPTTWTEISPDLTNGPHGGNNGQVNGTLTTIGVSPLDGDVIWTGSDDGVVHVTDDGGDTWTDVSATLPVRWITSVRADPFDAGTAYATISGFRWSEPLPHVFRTTDLGTTWEPIAGNLPEAPVNDLVADPATPGRLYVATDVGMFETLNGGASWTPMGTGLPNVVVTSIALSVTGTELFAGTYGRSVFSIGIEAPPLACPADTNDDGTVDVTDLIAVIVGWGTNDPDADVTGDGVVDVDDLVELVLAWGACP